MNKYNIILHTTTSCNFDCSYCDVVKDKKQLDSEKLEIFINFIKKNKEQINLVKFFGGEPLLAFKNIKYIIENTANIIGNKYELVTNTSLLNEEICDYLEKYFEIIFFSIDSENFFDYNNIFKLIDKYNLKNKVYFNLIISPGKEAEAYNQFEKIYSSGYKNFNILPVYFTKIWNKDDLSNLSSVMKNILDKSLLDKEINLFGFQKNTGYNSSLTYDALFIDIDYKIYYSDFVSTFLGKKIKDDLYIGNLDNFLIGDDLEDILLKKNNKLDLYEKSITSKIKGQIELHKIMDYFSKYLNIKKGILKD
ncbi:MAG: radical SAM protein [Candidatus Gracilibacteria bacterium]|nr:radical SAM protein [Candidatus Gracilibacteria bacterium]